MRYINLLLTPTLSLTLALIYGVSFKQLVSEFYFSLDRW